MIAVLLISCYDKQSRKADDSGRDDEMIAFLKGMVEDITENSLVLDVLSLGLHVGDRNREKMGDKWQKDQNDNDADDLVYVHSVPP